VGIGSIDLSQFDGPTLNGYVDGHNIMYKIWKSAEQAEYNAEVVYGQGAGTWGEILTVVSQLEPIFSIVQDVELDPYQINMASLCVAPENNSVSSILGGLDLLLVSNDDSDYYVPSYSVDQIGDVLETDQYNVFLNGGEIQLLSVEGLPVDANQTIGLNAFTMNLLPYLLQECMATSDVIRIK
jgi:hypothetical protein